MIASRGRLVHSGSLGFTRARIGGIGFNRSRVGLFRRAKWSSGLPPFTLARIGVAGFIRVFTLARRGRGGSLCFARVHSSAPTGRQVNSGSRGFTWARLGDIGFDRARLGSLGRA